MPIERVGPLTLSQQRTWLRGYWRGQGEFSPGWVRQWELPQGPPLEACVQAFGELVRRHEILRTTFHLGLDGQPVQIVHAATGFRLPIVVTGSLDSPGSDGSRPTLVGIQTSRPLWSLRLENTGGRVYRSALIFDHIISDGVGLANLRHQFDQLLAGQDPDRPIQHPIDRAAREQSKLQRAQTPRQDPFAFGPQLVCPPQQLPAEPARRYLVRTATYSALTALVDDVARPGRVSRSTVMLAALVDLLCRFGGGCGVNVASYLDHRVAGDVGVECQTRPVDLYVARPATLPVREALGEVQRRILDTYADDLRLGPVDPSTRARTNIERGAAATVPLFYDYQELQPHSSTSKTSTTAPGSVSFSDVLEPWGRPGSLFFYVYVRGDEIVMVVDIDTWLIDQDQADRLLHAIPELLAAWAEAPATALMDIAVNAPVSRSKTALFERGWFDGNSLQRLLANIAAGVDCSITCEGGRIVVTAAEPQDFERWHLGIAGHITEHLDVLLPDEYRSSTSGICWRPAQRTARPPATTIEHLLCEAITEATGVAVTDTGATFLEAGVEVEAGPVVVEALARERIRGCTSLFFAAPIPLSAVAQHLWIDTSPMSMAPVYLP